MNLSVHTLDHFVLYVKSIDATLNFYTKILGMADITFSGNRKALRFGFSKINLQEIGHELEPKAKQPLPGAMDLCFIVNSSLEEWISHLADHDIEIEAGPVKRTGAMSNLNSIYIRDPDGNLVELSIRMPI